MMLVISCDILTKFLKPILMPVALILITLSYFRDWQYSGIITSKKMRYSAYAFLILINIVIWGCYTCEKIFGYNIELVHETLFAILVVIFFVLGLTNYVPRHPPFSLRRKMFVLTMFVLDVYSLWIPLPQFVNPSSRTRVFLICQFLGIEGITRSAETLIEHIRNSCSVA